MQGGEGSACMLYRHVDIGKLTCLLPVRITQKMHSTRGRRELRQPLKNFLLMKYVNSWGIPNMSN